MGRGGQGEVWRARDRQHDRIVALKIRPVTADGDREHLLSEAGAVLRLRPHPCLPLVREDFFEDDAYCLVMDWIEGTSLDRLLERSGQLDLETVLRYVRRVAAALDHMHTHDPPVIHRDVKPSNIVVRSDGDIVLVDFGISSTADQGPMSRAGTRAFVAPEIASGAPPAPTGDVYGLAVTAFTLLTGAPPRPGPRPALPGISVHDAARVWSALEAGLAFDPKSRPSSAGELVAGLEPVGKTTNVPEFESRFVGRERAVADVAEALTNNRLVTLVGAGGVGKTRLAVEAARRIAPAYTDGVWIIELAATRDPALVARSTASTLGLDEPGLPSLDALRAGLRDRVVLIVLDNCEHLIEASGNLVRALIESCPSLDIIATSRERLGLDDEHVCEVEPLGVPGAEDASPKSVALSEAVRLFLDRAALERPDLRLTEETGPVIARICRRLDGMPLAIELAASRAGRLKLNEIAGRLEDRFALLRADDPTSPRHHTLRAAFEWSYELLSERQRELFVNLGVLPGGVELEGACAVLGSDASALDVETELEELARKSLLVRTNDRPRFSMLETVRSFALEKLRPDEDATRQRALDWLVGLAEEASDELAVGERSPWFARVETELDNIREALAFALEDRLDAVMLLSAKLGEFWALRGHWREARRYIAAAWDAEVGTVELRGEAAAVGGRLAFLEADYEEARRLHGESLKLHTAMGDKRGIASSLSSLGMVAEARGDFDRARELYGRSLATYRDVDDKRGIADQLTNLGNVAEYTADFDVAQSLHEQSLEQRRAIGDEQGAATTLLNLGYVMNYRGDARGREVLEESVALFQEVGDRHGASRALNLLAIRSWFEGDGEKARSLGEEALRMRHELGDRLGLAVSLESLAGLGAFQGHGVYAGELFGAAERLRETILSPITPSDQAIMNWARSDAIKAIGEESFEAALARGRTMRTDDAVALALTRPNA